MDRDYDGDGDFVIRANAAQREYSESDLEDSDDPREYDYPDEEEADENVENEEHLSERLNEFSDNIDGDRVEDNEEEEPFQISSGTTSQRGIENDAHRAPASLQQLLGFLSQSMETHGVARDSEASNMPDSDNRQGRRVEIADIFPEIFGFAGNGPLSGQNRTNGRVARLLENITSCHEDPYMAQESLREISEQLLMMNSITAERVIPQEELLKNVIQILESSRLQDQLELQMIACRCLYNLFEVNPGIIAVAVEHGVIGALRGKLLEISYIDLAEQVLETLEIISRLHGREILESGSLMVCLQYLDFFTSHAQRKAITIVVNSCARVRSQSFEEIAKVMPTLKEVFMSRSENALLLRVFDGFYGICSSMSKEQERLTQLFDYELVRKIMQIIINGETKVETRLKAFDLMSQLVLCSESLSTEILGSEKIVDVLLSSIDDYKKSSKSPLHERIMFAPKSLLTCISRFVAFLLPVEDNPVFSDARNVNVDLKGLQDKLEQLVEDITPILVEIFDNAVDFHIRKYVLIALARTVSSRMPHASSKINKSVISMIASSFARNKPIFEESGFQDLESGVLLLGCASFSRTLIERHPSEYLPAFQREGVFESIDNLLQQLALSSAGASSDNDSTHSSEEGELSEDSQVDYESDEDYDMDFDGFEGLGQVKPRKITFNVLKKLRLQQVNDSLRDNLQKITAISRKDKSISGELGEIACLVEKLRSLDVRSTSFDSWVSVWRDVKTKLFSSEFAISSFEFMTTGLASEMSRIITNNSIKTSVCQRAFIDAFGADLKPFVQILQSALTRIECFDLRDCGLHGDEGKTASLGKQMKLRLEYEGDFDGDEIPQNLRSITVGIHCVASFKSLNDFLKHKLLQSRIISSSSPLMAIESEAVSQMETWNFGFSYEGETCAYQDTIFGPIFRNCYKNKRESKHVWSDLHVLKYRKAGSKEEPEVLRPLYEDDIDVEADAKQVYDILVILKALRKSSLGGEFFVNSKMSAKLSCQLDEPLIVSGGCLPSWTIDVTRRYSFLFPFELRMFYLQSTSFGYGRLIQIWKNRIEDDKGEQGENVLHQLGRPTRHKLRISRDDIFLSALKILRKYGSSPNILEIEYSNEVGTGLGPTMEFYAIVSKEFAKKSLRLWRTDNFSSHQKDELVEGLLFPAPLGALEDQERVLALFQQLGVFVARSMLDNRILDFRFSQAFFELAHMYAADQPMLLEDKELALSILGMVDPQLEKSLNFLQKHKNDDVLESLSLTFHLPGYNVNLVANGLETAVTKNNFDQYLDSILDQIVGAGVEKQIRSFMQGFSHAFPYRSLMILTPEELTQFFGGVEEDWSTETLIANIEADHGYNHDSDIIQDLISLMSSFSDQERRQFLQFLTGSPKLPVGGFKTLSPKFTVVRKHTEENMTADEFLPSVMTCANYLKLPLYSNKAILKSRVIQAMTEGSGAFLLS
ncbi:LAME_0G16138g1_1 [Lachancea meyersii CBS 8951]|uniref:HECT-type E3 ubiquitin transferase n=1 Tax=Lachancea meyersii CBS 8951 TaxID=1266667 RepID=A0A1G4KB19_9SACH|nr:LAME_0G16138g1_1 [Lachancea meyersii CBS 8951]